ncbi:MAG: response regulator containing CheY-like receiver, AAA-type ATPase, and DNA-binding domain [Deltaproteobacteria bacterium]|nr:response regulator containing CheY-like receiver, AAA-type ATPase, and DNA-binding domain [Deltaproteobacteria bacterium]
MRILIVDDHKNTRLTLGTILRRSGHQVETAGTGRAALALLESEQFALVITDLRLGDLDGMEIVEKLHKSSPMSSVVVITAFGTIASAVRALKLGAYDYVTKPIQRDQILGIVDKIGAEKKQKHAPQDRGAGITPFIGRNAKILALLDLVDRVAQADVPVLILGESGTGKELIARRIHQLSPRRSEPFVAINCGALPENLQESELFGHRKGAFTGATDEKKGLLGEAAGGTVLLDEIAEISLATQVKLLRALENGEMRAVGGNDVNFMKCRILASTNQDLQRLVEEKRFRGDLLFRLNVMQTEIPPLRERPDDIPVLVCYFLDMFNTNYGKSITGFTSEAMHRLEEDLWPGNVRELRNCVERAVFLCRSTVVGMDDLPVQAQGSALKDSRRLLRDQEKSLILEALRRHNWNQKRAAAELGISDTTLWRKIKRFDLRNERL